MTFRPVNAARFNPPPPSAALTSQPLGSPAALLAPAAIVMPAARQQDWPIPRAAIALQPTQLQGMPSALILSPTPLPPGRQQDWPLPSSRPFSQDLRTFIQAPIRTSATISLYLAVTDTADAFAASLFTTQPVTPITTKPNLGFQTGGGGFASSKKDIPWETAKDIVRRWYDAIGFRWFEENSPADMRPSERAYFMDTVQQSPQIQYLLQNGYTLPSIYTLINQVKADNIDDDDGEAIALLLD